MTTCVVCGCDTWRDRLALGEWSYVACASCDLTRVEPFPSVEDAEALYGDEYFDAAANAGYDDYVADAAVHRRNGRARLRRLGAPPREGATLIDVGCAHGFTLIEAREAGWDPAGVDANATARQTVRDAGMACEASIADLGLDDASVDAVTFFQSLEHLTDPVAALTEARRLLAPEGSILIETWDRSSRTARAFGTRWQQLSPPSVVWLFDRPTMTALAAEAGLRLESWKWSTKWVTLGLVVGQIADGGSVLARGAEKVRGVPLPYVLGDLVTARLRPA
jgi:ubiquinone/menaquinone biosynthesis C-methylase UbiE